ncbi:polysulfide reductase NrfD [Anaerobacillus sp. HL2]|nr:polysulfide reductase NrfD [Anaerobacillus sp. HL2]
MYLGGIGVTLFLFSVILKATITRIVTKKLIKISAYAPVTAGVGLFALVTELGKPFRMIITYFYVNPQSVTSWGGFIQGAFLAVSFIYAVMLYMNKSGSLLNGLKVIGSFLAVAVGMYHGLHNFNRSSTLGRRSSSSIILSIIFSGWSSNRNVYESIIRRSW